MVSNVCLPENDNWRYSIFKPHLEYFSVFGKRAKLKRSKTPYKIFWTGEDTQYNFPEYKDNCIGDCNISLGFDYVTAPNYLRYPLWLLYYFGFNINKDKIADMVTEFNTHAKKFDNKKNDFCAMIARHDKNGIRKQLIDALSIIDTVSCPGSAYHNDNRLAAKYNDNKIDYLKQFKFTICPENISVKGYTTEKLFQAFDAGCIPIYWGGENIPEKDIINPKSYILYNGDAAIITETVKELYNNNTAYSDFKKHLPLTDYAVDYIYNINLELKKLFETYILI